MDLSMVTDLRQLQRVANFFGLGRKPAKVDKPVKVGLLGASQVATYAVIWPAHHVSKANVVAVAARDGGRAREYAKQHGIPQYYGSYEELLADPEVDAVYVGLPNGLHGHWTRKALQAGKHVLCEKPFASNAHEVREVQALARSKGLLCREAFHYREHPMATRLRELVLGPSATTSNTTHDSDTTSLTSAHSTAGLPAWLRRPAQPGGAGGALGPLQRIDVQLLIPSWVFGGGNIRFQDDLAGGAMMDAGCYCVNMLRLVSGAEPRVVKASAELYPRSKVTDGAMRAEVSWPQLPGVKGTLHASLQDVGWWPRTEVQVKGQRGTLHCTGFVTPFFGHRIHVRRSVDSHDTPDLAPAAVAAAGAQSPTAAPGAPAAASVRRALPTASGNIEEWVERVYGDDQETTYNYQLQRFVEDVSVSKGYCTDRSKEELQLITAGDQSDAMANQLVVDSCYEAAGLPLRQPSQVQRSKGSIVVTA